MRAPRFIGVLAFMAPLSWGCSSETQEPPDPPVDLTGSIAGLVHTEGGAPIADAEVHTTPATTVTTTDVDGRFTLEDVAVGVYEVTATADGFVVDHQSDVEVTADQTVQVDLELAADVPPGPTCVTCHLELDRLYASLEEDPPVSQPHEGGSAGEG